MIVIVSTDVDFADMEYLKFQPKFFYKKSMIFDIFCKTNYAFLPIDYHNFFTVTIHIANHFFHVSSIGPTDLLGLLPQSAKFLPQVLLCHSRIIPSLTLYGMVSW